VQHVLGAERKFVGLVDQQVQLGIGDQHIVQTSWIIVFHAEGVVHAHRIDISLPEYTVFAWKAETPVPLLPNHLDHLGIIRHFHDPAPDHKPGRQQGNNPDAGNQGQPQFQFLAFRFVMRLDTLFVPVLYYYPDKKQVDDNKNYTGDQKGQIEVIVKCSPI